VSTVLSHLGNSPDINSSKEYCGIIGENPSRGARSPKLWNAVFDSEGMDIRFHPFDVTGDHLHNLVMALKADDRFIGGSIAMPYKSAIIPLLDRVEPLARTIGAVNALYRDGRDIVGTNTDGAGAIHSLCEKLDKQELGDLKVAQIGLGGAGMAVAAYLADNLTKGGTLLLANRDHHKATSFAARLGEHVHAIPFPPDASELHGADIVINCTSLGFSTGVEDGEKRLERAMTPLGPSADIVNNISASIAALEVTNSDALVFDIVYQPRMTPFLNLASALGRRTLNGLGMNLEQAVIAFDTAINSKISRPQIRDAMAQVP